MKSTRTRIEDSVSPLGRESVAVIRAKGRILAETVLSPVDLPACDEALRDGYVIADQDLTEKPTDFLVTGEIAAGAGETHTLRTGTAYRIFTGAVIPEGGTRVVPFEQCREADSRVHVSGETPASSHIRKKASIVGQNDRLVAAGREIESDHISLLASLSIAEVLVSRQPRIACCCTGNELDAPGEQPGRGRKNSINGWILADRLADFGGLVEASELLPDDRTALSAMFSRIHGDGFDLLVTTGGMGPGRYDLVRSAFVGAGGEIILDSLPMRPGKSILLGKLGKTLCVALPGPPQAVRTLVNELVGPLLLLMQGAENVWPEPLQAVSAQKMRVRPAGVVRYRGGVLFFNEGRCMVRPAGILEPVSCFILIAPGSEGAVPGELLTVHLCR